MADYFEEMGWQPIDAESTQDHQTLLVARYYIDNGFFGDDFDSNSLAPPASKELVKNLPEKKCTSADEKCAICLKPNTDDSEEIFKVLPCTHAFHVACIMPWLERTNTCPLCRHEMLTDDKAYEERKKNRQRHREREEDLENLHNSMFG